MKTESKMGGEGVVKSATGQVKREASGGFVSGSGKLSGILTVKDKDGNLKYEGPISMECTPQQAEQLNLLEDE